VTVSVRVDRLLRPGSPDALAITREEEEASVQRITHRAATVAIGIASVAVSTSASAAVITFGSSTDLTDNFRDLTTPQALSVSGGVLNVTSNSSSARAIVYDTTPADATIKTSFSAATDPVSASFDVGSITAANTSIGVYFIDAAQAENLYASGIILLNVNNSGEADLVRVASYVQPSTASAGSLATVATGSDLGIGLNGPMTTVTASYTRINAQNSSLALTIGSTTVTGNFTGYWTPTNVEVGLRLFPATTGASLQLDNFAVGPIPEPASAAMLGMVGLVIGRRRRA
jgi:hypothetical protein